MCEGEAKRKYFEHTGILGYILYLKCILRGTYLRCRIHAGYMQDTCICKGNQDTCGIHPRYMMTRRGDGGRLVRVADPLWGGAGLW